MVDHTRARRTMVCTIKKRFLRWILHRGAISGIGMDGSPGAVRYRCYSKVAFQPIYTVHTIIYNDGWRAYRKWITKVIDIVTLNNSERK